MFDGIHCSIWISGQEFSDLAVGGLDFGQEFSDLAVGGSDFGQEFRDLAVDGFGESRSLATSRSMGLVRAGV